MSDYTGIIIQVLSIIMAIGISWGMLHGRLIKIEKEQDDIASDLKELRNTYVPKNLFESVTIPLQLQLSELQRDIKSILRLLSSKQNNKDV